MATKTTYRVEITNLQDGYTYVTQANSAQEALDAMALWSPSAFVCQRWSATATILDPTKTEYAVVTSSARMPLSCWGRYRRVAVVCKIEGSVPKMISDRARGIVEIVRDYGPQHEGSTERCAYERALIEAEDLAWELNQQSKGATL